MSEEMNQLKVAVILSGCGVYDGSEAYETVLTLLRLDEMGASVSCFAPNNDQLHVINHLSGDENTSEKRSILQESARLVRGEISDISEASVEEFDAVIVPGGYGAAKNLCTFAVDGAEMKININFQSFMQRAIALKKPIGLICIAPVMSGLLFGKGVSCTIGTDESTADVIRATGGIHKNCNVDEICVDDKHRLVTTPAYMSASRISEASAGITKLVDKVIQMASK